MATKTASATPAKIPDKEVIRADLEATRKAYHELLDSLSAEDWNKKTPNEPWSVGQLMWHVAWGLGVFPRGVNRCRKGRGFRPPVWIANSMNKLITRIGSRGVTKEGLAAMYDANHAAMLACLDEVRDDEWQKGALSPFGQYFTVEQMFSVPADHFDEHRKDIWLAVRR